MTEYFNLHDGFEQKYGISGDDNAFLAQTILKLRTKRPYVKDSQEFTIMVNEETSVIQLWIRTVGCSFSKVGSCSVCDYWIGNRLEHPDEIVKKALSPYKGQYATLIFNTCGSPFDYKELILEEQERIWKAIEQMGFQIVIIETHMNTVDECRLNLLKKIIHAYLVIEIGLESSNTQILKYSLNKKVSMEKLKDIIQLVHKYRMGCCANILLGVPFLSVSARIDDCICSVKDALEAGVDTCVVFPINLKEYTLISFLARNGLYEPVNGWELIMVLNSFAAEELECINIAWYEEREQNNLSYENPMIPPAFCPDCRWIVYRQLSKYSAATKGKVREDIVKQLCMIECQCRNAFMERYAYGSMDNRKVDLDFYYARIKSLMEGGIENG